MKKTGILKAELRRAFTSPGFFLGIIAMTAVLFIAASSELALSSQYPAGTCSVAYFYMCINGANKLSDIMLVVAVLPYAMSFCADKKNNFFRPIIARTSPKSYSTARALTCFIATFCAVALGCLTFILTLRVFFPLTVPDNVGMATFTGLPWDKHPILELTIYIFIRSLAAAFWGELSLMSTAFVPSVFAALCFPLIAYNVMCILPDIFGQGFSVSYLQSGEITLGSWQFTLIYTCIFFIGLSLICAIVFKKQVRRIVENA